MIILEFIKRTKKNVIYQKKVETLFAKLNYSFFSPISIFLNLGLGMKPLFPQILLKI